MALADIAFEYPKFASGLFSIKQQSSAVLHNMLMF